ncbi:MAG: 3-dehydroquinate dehydratase [Cytophagales bacterium]|nr:3-dehydroquinate dehydratase [Cytophagales bacterium]
MNIYIVNGPNLNLLGKREKTWYGNKSFSSFLQELQNTYTQAKINYFQSNSEGDLINHLHQIGFSAHGIILNAGGYTHSSIALSDAIRAISADVIEVHISNIYKRESYRQHSYLSAHVLGTITGLGLEVYRLALEYFLSIPRP